MRGALKIKVSENESESTSSDESSSQSDEENFTSFIGSHTSLPRETYKDKDEEVESIPTMEVDDLEIEPSTSEDETKSVEDLQDEYNQLYEECLKQSEKLLLLSMRLKTSEDEKKKLHVDLVKSKVDICGLEEENKKSLHDKVNFLESEHQGPLESKKGLEYKLIKLDRDLHKSQELLNRLP
ncbi:unnamed protein product [Ilex paraguariensis]|uniref:Uncharacterized protein n=1 Tax=Ilex paraguariensis TaxID=185542 RepID=A0ABC8UHF6_9AQUA